MKQLNDFEVENMIICGIIVFLALLLNQIQTESIQYLEFTVLFTLYALLSVFAVFNLKSLLATYVKKYRTQLDQFKLAAS